MTTGRRGKETDYDECLDFQDRANLPMTTGAATTVKRGRDCEIEAGSTNDTNEALMRKSKAMVAN